MRLLPNDGNRTVRVNGDTLGHASHQDSVQAMPAVRPKNDEVSLLGFGGAKDDPARISRRVLVLFEDRQAG